MLGVHLEIFCIQNVIHEESERNSENHFQFKCLSKNERLPDTCCFVTCYFYLPFFVSDFFKLNKLYSGVLMSPYWKKPLVQAGFQFLNDILLTTFLKAST